MASNILHILHLTLFAEYSCGAYGAGAYEGTCGGLANTGSDMLWPLVIGVALVVVSAVLLIAMLVRRRRERKQSAGL